MKKTRRNYAIDGSKQSSSERVKDLIVIANKEEGLPHGLFEELDHYMSLQQKKFVQSYIRTGDLRLSSELAGWKPAQGHRSMADPKVKLYLEELMRYEKMTNVVTTTMLLAELKELAFFDVNQVLQFDAMGRPMVNAEGLKKHGKSIKKVKFNVKSSCLELEFYDRMDALEKLGRHIGFYEKDNEQKKTDNVAIFLPDNSRGNERTDDVVFVEV